MHNDTETAATATKIGTAWSGKERRVRRSVLQRRGGRIGYFLCLGRCVEHDGGPLPGSSTTVWAIVAGDCFGWSRARAWHVEGCKEGLFFVEGCRLKVSFVVPAVVVLVVLFSVPLLQRSCA